MRESEESSTFWALTAVETARQQTIIVTSLPLPASIVVFLLKSASFAFLVGRERDFRNQVARSVR